MTGFPAQLAADYEVESQGPDAWTLRCKHCGARYRLNKPDVGGEVKIGNVLTLMNHAASHPRRRADPLREQHIQGDGTI